MEDSILAKSVVVLVAHTLDKREGLVANTLDKREAQVASIPEAQPGHSILEAWQVDSTPDKQEAVPVLVQVE